MDRTGTSSKDPLEDKARNMDSVAGFGATLVWDLLYQEENSISVLAATESKTDDVMFFVKIGVMTIYIRGLLKNEDISKIQARYKNLFRIICENLSSIDIKAGMDCSTFIEKANLTFDSDNYLVSNWIAWNLLAKKPSTAKEKEFVNTINMLLFSIVEKNYWDSEYDYNHKK